MTPLATELEADPIVCDMFTSRMLGRAPQTWISLKKSTANLRTIQVFKQNWMFC